MYINVHKHSVWIATECAYKTHWAHAGWKDLPSAVTKFRSRKNK